VSDSSNIDEQITGFRKCVERCLEIAQRHRLPLWGLVRADDDLVTDNALA
jgi:hypothetical protein